MRDEFGRTPLHWSCEKGHMEVVSFLVEHGGDVKLQDGCGRPPLEWATRAGHLNMVQFLVKNGASVKTLNSDGKTSLHLASQKGYTEVNNVHLSHLSLKSPHYLMKIDATDDFTCQNSNSIYLTTALAHTGDSRYIAHPTTSPWAK